MIKYDSKLYFLIISFNGIIINKIYRTAFHEAVESNSIEIVKLFLTNDKFDINFLYIFIIFLL